MRTYYFLIGFVMAQVLAVAQDHTNRTMEEMHHLHQDSKAYIAMLEDPKRDAYQNPHQVIQLQKGTDASRATARNADQP